MPGGCQLALAHYFDAGCMSHTRIYVTPLLQAAATPSQLHPSLTLALLLLLPVAHYLLLLQNACDAFYAAEAV